MRPHDRVVLEVTELHVADQLVDAEVGVVQHLLQAVLGIADDDHVGVAELLRVEVAVDLALQQREDLRRAPLRGSWGTPTRA